MDHYFEPTNAQMEGLKNIGIKTHNIFYNNHICDPCYPRHKGWRCQKQQPTPPSQLQGAETQKIDQDVMATAPLNTP